MTERPKTTVYSPAELEAKWYEYWQRKGMFRSLPDHRPAYSIVIPPPNVTGALHLGHALNNVIQDVLIRFHRMRGYNACWVPGTDHAGIATQSVVEKRLMKEEGKTRHDVGRKVLLEKIWGWKEKFGNRIIEQLKSLGCSCDWDRTCFTMDPHLSHAVKHVFVELFREGMIYRGKRLINWCPGCRTALSNDELAYKDVDAYFWEIRYPVKGEANRFVTVATTRPETMLGDTAVAVNSKDERYSGLVGRKCVLPLMEREIPIIADDILADPQKGTGAVKVTPGHDPNDYQCGLRNGLPMIDILDDGGTLNENAGEYAGMPVLAAREKVLADLEKRGLLGRKSPIRHSVAHCYRSDDVVEPHLSQQWFVRMAPLVELARKAVLDGEVTFFPAKRRDDYLRWLEQTPDWCISRQIWWGHRIPIWYCPKCSPEIVLDENGEPVRIPENAEPLVPERPEANVEQCPRCGHRNLVQDPDVLDTWFSSQLWPLSTFGWPPENAELKYYYPTNVLVTGRDIIALWVARMVMMGMKFLGAKPFSHVFINPTIQDERGDIMSKSRGNGVDPLKLIAGGVDQIEGSRPLDDIPASRTENYPVYGCDALRYSLMSSISGQMQDLRLRVNRKKIQKGVYEVQIPLFEEGRRFCNKIWQACHGVIFANCAEAKSIQKQSPHIEDIWLEDRMHHLISQATQAFAEYNFGAACEALYRFFWDDLCSWYLEIAKPRLWEEQGKESKQHAQSVLLKTLDAFLRLLHPVMPYLTEELWQELRGYLQQAGRSDLEEACIVARWPKAEDFETDEGAARVVELAREVTSAINNVRAEQKGIAEGQKIPLVILHAPEKEVFDKLEALFPGIQKLAKVERIETRGEDEKPACCVMRTAQRGVKIYVPLEGLVDFEAEKERLRKEQQKLEAVVQRLRAKLANQDYLAKAPVDVVDKDRRALEESEAKWRNVERELADWNHR